MKFDYLVNLLLTESESKVLKLRYGELLPKNYTGVIEYADGSKAWYLNDLFHREDGPAIEFSNGSKTWWLNGHKITEEEFNQRRKLRELGGADFDGILDI